MVEPRIRAESFPDNIISLLRGREKVFFEIREEANNQGSILKTARMYDAGGRILGSIAYELTPDDRALVHNFQVESWSQRSMYPQRLLKWFVVEMRLGGLRSIEGSLFGLSASGHDKLVLFRENGFEMMEMGTMTGRSEYSIKKLL